ncbi:hypothetical protein TNCV_911421 [Trichonephila clavipes]|nr:hypothetical protein TNCV_911421 [Trichonephila clavipes]
MATMMIGCDTTLDDSTDVVGSKADVLKTAVSVTPPQPSTIKWWKGIAENVALVSECVRKGRRQTLAQIAEDTHFSKKLFEEIHSSPMGFLPVPINEKNIYGDAVLCHSDEGKGASQEALQEVEKKDFQLYFQKLHERS